VGAAPTWATRDRPTGVGHPPLDAGEGLVSPEEIRDEVGFDALEAPPQFRWPQDDGRTGAGRRVRRIGWLVGPPGAGHLALIDGASCQCARCFQ
jgi:hypothetical protein